MKLDAYEAIGRSGRFFASCAAECASTFWLNWISANTIGALLGLGTVAGVVMIRACCCSGARKHSRDIFSSR